MQFYFIGGLGEPVYACDMAEVRFHVRRASPMERDDMYVELVEVSADKRNIARLLNSQGGFQGATLRAWRVTRRGGLVEEPVDLNEGEAA